MNYGRGVQVNQDYTKAKVVLVALRDEVKTPVELDSRQARSIAISLLQAADEAESQRRQNLRRAQDAMQHGNVDAAAEIAKANDFTDKELNS